jgi:hypothetical protein
LATLAAVVFVLAALLLAAPVIVALMPAVVQFDPQTCKHWENINRQLLVHDWFWAKLAVTEEKRIITAVISFIWPL